MAEILCKDCKAEGVTTFRPLGKKSTVRCTTHHRKFVEAGKDRAHARYVKATYNLEPEQYQAIKAAQNGKCFICAKSTGAARRLSCDHDHSCCDGPRSCGKCVRALLCRPCNDLLGVVRDDIEVLKRAIIVLRDHPAQAVLNSLDIIESEVPQ